MKITTEMLGTKVASPLENSSPSGWLHKCVEQKHIFTSILICKEKGLEKINWMKLTLIRFFLQLFIETWHALGTTKVDDDLCV